MAKAKFVCTRPCFHNAHRYFLGDIVEGDIAQMPKDKDGKLAHFKEISPGDRVVPDASGVAVGVNSKTRNVK
jgi:hypothetical protein